MSAMSETDLKRKPPFGVLARNFRVECPILQAFRKKDMSVVGCDVGCDVSPPTTQVFAAV